MPDLTRIIEWAIGSIVGLLAVSVFRAYIGAGDDETLAVRIADAMGWDRPETSSSSPNQLRT